MPRLPKPYLFRDHYVSRTGGEYVKLCHKSAGLKEAQRLLKEHLKDREQEREQNGGRLCPTLTVAELAALFLATVKVEKSHHTYLDYQRWLTEFAAKHGDRPARSITKQDALAFRNGIATATYNPVRVTKGKARNKRPEVRKPYKPKTVNHAVIACKACWNWAVANDYLPAGKNPFSKLPLLHTEDRQRVITDDEFQALLRNNTDALFRQVLLTLRYTSARPGEVRKLTWPQVDWNNKRLVIRRHKSSRTTKVPLPRLIPLPDCVLALLRWLKGRHGHQPYCFLNSDGNPWTKDAFVQRMESLRRRAGIAADENGEQLVLYHNRHTFLTAAASAAGISGPMLQDLAGHTDAATTKRYAHLANQEMVRAGQRVADALRPRKPGR